MNRLPTGTYQPGDSLLHRAPAIAKLVGFTGLTVLVILTRSLWGYAIMTAVVLALAFTSALRPADIFSPVWRLRWFFIVIFLMNLCFFSPEEAWVRWWIFTPSEAGLIQGVNVAARVALILILSNVLTVTTAPLALTEALEKLLSPLKRVGIPTAQIAMILSVAVRFIPTLMEETDMIRKAQTARGARFDSRRLTEKAAAVLPLVVPIFLSAFRRADELSLAMEARGYRIETK